MCGLIGDRRAQKENCLLKKKTQKTQTQPYTPLKKAQQNRFLKVEVVKDLFRSSISWNFCCSSGN